LSIVVDVQYATSEADVPSEPNIQAWVIAALVNFRKKAELTVRIVDEKEGRDLNHQWRDSEIATNVLSFCAEGLEDIEPDLLGDVIICAPVVLKEALEQKKPSESHWVHMVIHGTLHLIGYDHIDDGEAEVMESLEINILEKLGYTNPYLAKHYE
jgi:probable rRNA maturation factor